MSTRWSAFEDYEELKGWLIERCLGYRNLCHMQMLCENFKIGRVGEKEVIGKKDGHRNQEKKHSIA